MLNINAGYGQALFNRMGIAQKVGKIVVVGSSSIAHYSDYRAMFTMSSADAQLHFVETVDAAIDKCTANSGDTIFVLPGHSETITGTGITVDVAGLSIVGLGTGSLIPNIIHNHADAEVSISASNSTWENFRHTADVTAVKVGVEIEDAASYVTVRGCKFDVNLTGTDEFLVSVRTNDASNFAIIEDNDFNMGLGGAVAAISFTKDTEGTIVRGNTAIGDYSTANINGITTLSTNLLIENNLLVNGLTGAVGTEPGIELLTGTTGILRNNQIASNLATIDAAIVADAMMLFENYYCEAVTETGALIGTPSVDD